jgi:hypothetical protein
MAFYRGLQGVSSMGFSSSAEATSWIIDAGETSRERREPHICGKEEEVECRKTGRRYTAPSAFSL